MRKKSLNLPKQRAFIGPALVWKRIVAFVIDIIVIEFVFLFPFQALMKKMVPESLTYSEAYNILNSNTEYMAIFSVIIFIISILAIAYFAILEYRFGQSIGKILMNIKVVGKNKRLAFWQCICRSLFLLPVFPFFLLWVIDPLYLFFNKSSQRLSEVLTKTRVVERYALD